jgi:nicotinamide-nucleotide amidase
VTLVEAAVCSVGTEVVNGEHADTNGAWLARRLAELGVDVRWQIAVGDRQGDISESVRWLADRCDVVIVGGGIGPTHDDVTRAAVADVAGTELERRDDLEAVIRRRFEGYGMEMPPANLGQAEVPIGSVAYEPVGTAAGFRVEVERPDQATCTVHVLPGVPFELREMFERDVSPHVIENGGGRARVIRDVHVTGMGESAIAERLADVISEVEDDEAVELALLASTDEVRVKITGYGPTPEHATKNAGMIVTRVVDQLGAAVAGMDEERIEQTVARLLRLTGSTVATAESCTAGAVSARLSTVTGATDFLRGGLVSYATDVKVDVLGVPRDLLEEHGPCAPPTAETMAQRARELFDADYGIGVTCVAGPDPQGGTQVGTTIWALATPAGEVRSWTRIIPGDRPHVTGRAAVAAIEALRRELQRVTDADAGPGQEE